MERVASEDAFQRFRAAGSGYIYNDFSPRGSEGNILHGAACWSLGRASTAVDKYVSADMHTAVAWLDTHRAGRWRRCLTGCLAAE